MIFTSTELACAFTVCASIVHSWRVTGVPSLARLRLRTRNAQRASAFSNGRPRDERQARVVLGRRLGADLRPGPHASFLIARVLVSGAIHVSAAIRRPIAALISPVICSALARASGGKYCAEVQRADGLADRLVGLSARRLPRLRHLRRAGQRPRLEVEVLVHERLRPERRERADRSVGEVVLPVLQRHLARSKRGDRDGRRLRHEHLRRARRNRPRRGRPSQSSPGAFVGQLRAAS